MPENNSSEKLLDMTAQEFELMLTRALCVAARYGALYHAKHVGYPENDEVSTDEGITQNVTWSEFLAPLHEAIKDDAAKR